MKIQHLHLKTTPLAEMRRFYTVQLGFSELESGPEYFTISAGASTLRFEQAEGGAYYHFAFNIPDPDVEAAAVWLREKHAILDWNGKEVIDFDAWNAQAVYFRDPAGNIVEFIGRRNLGWPTQGAFTAASIGSISEMGVPTQDIRAVDQELAQVAGLVRFDCDIQRFCAIGDEEGLFIVIDRNQKKWIPKMDLALPFPFTAQIENKGNFEVRFEQEVFEVKQVD